jgi:hypothetical protein
LEALAICCEEVEFQDEIRRKKEQEDLIGGCT